MGMIARFWLLKEGGVVKVVLDMGIADPLVF